MIKDILAHIPTERATRPTIDASVANHLARAGLPIKLIDLPASRSEIQPYILSIAADEDLDTLVMGALWSLRRKS